MRSLVVAGALAAMLSAGCAERSTMMRDPTVGEIGGGTVVGLAAAAFVSGPLAVGALAGAASTVVDPDTRLSELLTGGYYRHSPRVCRTLRDCVFSGAH
ncbi:MAG: hypothetical protein H6842_02515 [Rhodospirillaceae bacterium]|nr:hypothetical protein [Rhodospirillaceae bacterium]